MQTYRALWGEDVVAEGTSRVTWEIEPVERAGGLTPKRRGRDSFRRSVQTFGGGHEMRMRSEDESTRDGPFVVTPFVFADATDAQYEALNRLLDLVRIERDPGEPPTPTSVLMHRFRHLPSFVEVHAWTVTRDGREEVVGFGAAYLPLTPENGHLAEFSLAVHTDVRRQGIGRRLFTCIVEAAVARGRRLLVGATEGRVPAGEAFMLRIGATPGVKAQTHQLDLSGIDRGLVGRWLEIQGQHVDTYEIGRWNGPYPDDEIEAVAALYDVMNGQPRDDLEVHDERMTPDQLRELERFSLTDGKTRWTLFLRARADGALVGFTDVVLDARRPELALQGNTGVFPEHRRRGLGRWLKAAMLQGLLAERPDVRFVRTTNADSNAAMRRINEDLGFVPYASVCMWQVTTSDALASLTTASWPLTG